VRFGNIRILMSRACQLTCFLFLFSAFSAVSVFGNSGPPHIVIILADDMGYGDVRPLNPESQIPTPNIDRIAREGMTFTDGHSPSAVCTPTRYGLLTGRYAWRTRLKRGVLGGYSPPLVSRDRLTVAGMLKKRGYRTAAVGKWHLGMQMPLLPGRTLVESWEGDPGIDFSAVIPDAPVDHGFDSFFGVSASLDMAPYVFIRNNRFAGKPALVQPAVPFPHFIRRGPRSADFIVDRVLDRLTEEAVEVIRRSSRDDRPFFLYFALTAPHKPTQPAERFRGKTGLGEYGDFVAQVDWTVGRVLQAIDEAGIADRTLVFFSADNGSYMYALDESKAADHVQDPSVQGYFPRHHRPNGHFRGTKADIWEGGHRVPFFARWPQEISPGSQCSATVSLIDLFATCAEIAGAALPSNAAEDSLSIYPLLRGESRERPGVVVHHSVSGMFAVRKDRWKLVLGNGSGGREKPAGTPFVKPYQLFDLEQDPGESRNLAAEKPEIVQKLEAALEAVRGLAEAAEPQPNG